MRTKGRIVLSMTGLMLSLAAACRSSPVVWPCPGGTEPTEHGREQLEEALRSEDWRGALSWVKEILRSEDLIRDGLTYWCASSGLIRILAHAPAPFYAAYRAAFDSEAENAVRSGLTPDAWERWFFCTGMDGEGDRLAARLLDEGKPDQALEIWRTLSCYPDSSIPKEIFLARAMTAAALCGSPEAIRAVESSPAMVSVGGKILSLDGWQESLLRDLRAGRIRPTWGARPVRSAADFAVVMKRETIDFIDVLSWEVSKKGKERLVLFKAADAVGSHVFWCGSRVLVAVGDQAALLDPSTREVLWMAPLEEAPLPKEWLSAIRAGSSR